MTFPNEHVAKANDSVCPTFSMLWADINPLLEKELTLLELSWQEQQECTQINNERDQNPEENRNTISK